MSTATLFFSLKTLIHRKGPQGETTTETKNLKLIKNAHRKCRNARWMSVESSHCNSYALGVLLSLLAAHLAVFADAGHDTSRVEGRQFSQPLTTMTGDRINHDDTFFKPIIPKDLSREYISSHIFTKSGQYRVFQPEESDLRIAVLANRKTHEDNFKKEVKGKQEPQLKKGLSATKKGFAPQKSKTTKDQHNMFEHVAVKAAQKRNESSDGVTALQQELKGLEELLMEYTERYFIKGDYEPQADLVQELYRNHSSVQANLTDSERFVRSTLMDEDISAEVPRALQTGRLLFFSGLKKVLWPIYMGLQVLKSLMLALFLPTIIGSVSRLIGKGITSGSAGSAPIFIRPMEAPQDLDFRDTNFGFDDDSNKFTMPNDDSTKNNAAAGGGGGGGGATADNPGFEYNQEATQTQWQYAPYNMAAIINQQALSRYGMNERQHQALMQDTYMSALQSIGAASFKNSQGISSGSFGALGGSGGSSNGMNKKPISPANMNTFQTFQKVPASSLLLSNYDPFYSPLLSRLDSVFAQLKLNSENEVCREKLICLMYANPTKYAPYSNLVSAQLSRELNELRKPTSDNPDILRFFKYMRAAKDGQDGVDCEQSFAKCKEFKDFENPAMLSTYNDINKLVQARKMG